MIDRNLRSGQCSSSSRSAVHPRTRGLEIGAVALGCALGLFAALHEARAGKDPYGGICTRQHRTERPVQESDFDRNIEAPLVLVPLVWNRGVDPQPVAISTA